MRPVTDTVEGFTAVIFQHEIDHLDGKVFVEHLSQMKQSRIKQKLKKRERQSL